MQFVLHGRLWTKPDLAPILALLWCRHTAELNKDVHAMELQNALAVGIPALTVVVWLLRLEGRVNTQDAMQRQLSEDVKYIRNRIDRALESD